MPPIIHRARTGRVDVVLAEASISSVDWAEVVQKIAVRLLSIRHPIHRPGFPDICLFVHGDEN